MHNAINNLVVKPEHILVDGNEILSGGMGRPRNGLAGFKNPSPQFKKFFLIGHIKVKRLIRLFAQD